MRKYAALLCCMFFGGMFLIAQELKHEVAVVLKLIQVYVTDSAGNPITDLKPDEFIVYDNRKLQNITEFERHLLFPPEAEAVSPPEKKDLARAGAPDDVMNRKFFLFFDLVNNNAKGFQKAQEAALHFLDNQVQPSDEVGVLSYSVLKQLTLHEYLTKDRRAVRSVVRQIGGTGRIGRAENFEALLYQEMTGEQPWDASQQGQSVKDGAPARLRNLGLLPDSLLAEGAMSGARFNREQYKNLIHNMFERLTGLSKALRYISGNKHIILFSSGVPYSMIHGLETGSPTTFTSLGMDAILRSKYQEMIKELSNSNTTVFSLNTESLATNMNLPSHQKGEATLRSISKYTGGKFVGNVQNYDQVLDTIQTFTGSYYVLGFQIDESWDGRYHSIEVKVTRPNCKVFAQKGYFNPKPFSKYSAMEKELHLIDLALSDRSLLQNPVDIPMTVLPCSVGNEQGICLLAQINMGKIKESIGEKAEIYFIVFDEKEDIKEMKRKAVKLSALKGKEAYYYSIMRLSPGSYKCRIVMRDMDKGSGAVGRYSVEIPEIPEKGLMLFPPLLLAPGKAGLFVRGYVPETMSTDFPLLDCFPFDPAKYSPILGAIPGDMPSILAVLHCSVRNLTNPRVRFTAHMVEKSSGESIPLTVSILSGKKEGEMGTILAKLKLPDIKPGEYVLVISANDTSSQARSQTFTPCKIR
ncbi:MAG: VWA domain-containing protein [Candidatus Aminicenantes bacterium]|nr:VWA domain-containing protein [Candidatus Aminicenantes bacterium]